MKDQILWILFLHFLSKHINIFHYNMFHCNMFYYNLFFIQVFSIQMLFITIYFIVSLSKILSIYVTICVWLIALAPFSLFGTFFLLMYQNSIFRVFWIEFFFFNIQFLFFFFKYFIVLKIFGAIVFPGLYLDLTIQVMKHLRNSRYRLSFRKQVIN